MTSWIFEERFNVPLSQSFGINDSLPLSLLIFPAMFVQVKVCTFSMFCLCFLQFCVILHLLLRGDLKRHEHELSAMYLQTADPAPFTSQTVLIPQGEGVQGDWGATLPTSTTTAARRESSPCSMMSDQAGGQAGTEEARNWEGEVSAPCLWWAWPAHASSWSATLGPTTVWSDFLSTWSDQAL